MKIRGFKLNELQDAWIAICTCIANIWFNWIFCKMRELQYEHKVHEFWCKIEWTNIVSLHNQKVGTGRVSRNTDERQRVGTNNTSKQSGHKLEMTKIKWITNQGVGSGNRGRRNRDKRVTQTTQAGREARFKAITHARNRASHRFIVQGNNSNLSAHRVCTQSLHTEHGHRTV